MFDLPDAKRVRRSELYPSRSQSPVELDESLALDFQKQLEAIYGSSVDVIDKSPITVSQAPTASHEHENDATGYAFRLFASPSTTTTALANNETKSQSDVSKIILDNDRAVGPGAFLIPERPASYYFSTPLSPTRKSEYKASAVSASDLYAHCTIPYPALEKPWKVTIVRVTRKRGDVVVTPHALKSTSIDSNGAEGGKPQSRTKLNKAGRIKARKRKRVEEQVRLEKEQVLMRKAESEKEKKVRRNREKKLKKREKEKAEKAAARMKDATAADQVDASSGGQNSDAGMTVKGVNL